MNRAESLPPPRYEPTDGLPGIVVLTAIGLAAGIAIVLAIAVEIARHHGAAHSAASATGNELSFTHGPQERTSIARDWSAQDAAVRDHLETYGWSDRSHGIVRIPIDRAIELLSREAMEAPGKEAR